MASEETAGAHPTIELYRRDGSYWGKTNDFAIVRDALFHFIHLHPGENLTLAKRVTEPTEGLS